MTENTLSLIAAPRATIPLASAADEAKRALVELGARIDGVDWLADDLACDILFDDRSRDEVDAAVRSAVTRAFGPAPIDMVVQPCAGRKKALLVADMEATIIANEMLEELAELRGLRAHIAAITAHAMNGDLDFASALKERVALLKDLPESALAETAARIRLNPGARALVATMHKHGAYTALVSGGFRVYANHVRRELGFDTAVANDLVIEDGKLAGTVQEPILTRDAKLATLTVLAAEHGLPLAATLAVGDGANDLPMIQAAGMGIAYHAKPAVAAQARRRVDHADLTALLYAQGYRRDEIVESV